MVVLNLSWIYDSLDPTLAAHIEYKAVLFQESFIRLGRCAWGNNPIWQEFLKTLRLVLGIVKLFFFLAERQLLKYPHCVTGGWNLWHCRWGDVRGEWDLNWDLATLHGRIRLNPLSSYICFSFAVQLFKLNSSLSKLRFSQVTKHLMQARDKIEAFGSEIVLSPIPSAQRIEPLWTVLVYLASLSPEDKFTLNAWRIRGFPVLQLAILDNVLCVLKAVEREFAQIMSELAACAAPAILSFEILNPACWHQYAGNEETALSFKKVAR